MAISQLLHDIYVSAIIGLQPLHWFHSVLLQQLLTLLNQIVQHARFRGTNSQKLIFGQFLRMATSPFIDVCIMAR